MEKVTFDTSVIALFKKLLVKLATCKMLLKKCWYTLFLYIRTTTLLEHWGWKSSKNKINWETNLDWDYNNWGRHYCTENEVSD